ncbi:Predicted dienelactone hydrolase (plasmid) [Tsukamurella tyrosinosolvens]|uniref:Alpha/beta hydrolase family protein n=2 Tax=Tsukamurella tyrosinosolvens TaxID=57704 RepID=A0A1H4N748_TSUTY|nr:Alpha/beta hydrolase family protein [Tsukamurella tyrosinosolvens]VEI00397.1 Predicted dienelactone hydrolase [Tsukamurella tyrosinosolvens]
MTLPQKGPREERRMISPQRWATIAVVASLLLAAAIVAAFGRTSSDDPPAPSSSVEETKHRYLTIPGVEPDTLSGFLFRPSARGGTGTMPTIVLIHGGGWLKGATAEYVRPAAEALAARGFVVWSLNYRRVGDGGGWPTTFTDLAAGVDHLTRLQSDAPEIDLTRVTVVGHSAGGQLAAWTAGRGTLPDGAPGANPAVRPHAAVSLAGVLDMRLSLTKNDHVLRVMGGTPEQYPDRYLLVDPLERMDPRVPVVAITGTDDTVVPPREAAEYVEALRRKGGSTALIEIPQTGHGDVIDVRNAWWPMIVSAISTVAEHGPRAVPIGSGA